MSILQVVGLHYFSPVEKMDLIEVIKTKDTTKETLGMSQFAVAIS